MELSWMTLVILILASFRLTRLIVDDTIMEWLRSPFIGYEETVNEEGDLVLWPVIKGSGIRGWFGELLSCQWCTGLWCSLFIILMWKFMYMGKLVLIVLAISGGQSLLYRWLGR
ncbi:DUF1360 domain-containing protein [Thalassobacillus sp. CUG 92003]|uniref:DUF1360 domain-containing protein n=1 Tax=Thalassobacillus sp. CUG 92003 TaxID=2736641 RepID=UPI0015E725EE|nr:DUF1360 domain-containing protein [Thalassobacillus sp. CUG 92003]